MKLRDLVVIAASALAAAACSGAATHQASSHGASSRPSTAAASSPAAAARSGSYAPSAATAAASPSSVPATTPAGPLLLIYPRVVPSADDYGVVEPTVISITPDVNAQITHLHWSTWNQRYAVGTGDAVADDCVPDCAQGSIRLFHINIALTGVVGGHFTSMSWGNGSTIHNNLFGRGLILVGSSGGRKVAQPHGASVSSPTSAPPQSVSPPPATTPAVGPHNYNDPAQLDRAVAAQVQGQTGHAVTSSVCRPWPSTPHRFTCTVFMGQYGSDVAGVLVSADGLTYTITSSG
jgi:hypothetical protein